MTTKSAFNSMLAWTAIMLNLSACNGQTMSEETYAKGNELAAAADTPQVSVRVNKEYDWSGNLIAYDSSYTSVYQSRSGDPAYMDSVLGSFMPGFSMRYPFLNDPGFHMLFFPDSSFHRDFFQDDFFQRSLERNQRTMERMMEQMDSLKNQHFLRPVPYPEEKNADGAPSGPMQGSALTPLQPRASRENEIQRRERRESVEL